MPYCDECGNKVSVSDKRCSKCGNKLDIVPPTPPKGGDDAVTRVRGFFSPEPYHNIEFILALLGVVFSVLAVPQSLNSFSFTYSGLLPFILIALFAAVIGAIVIRYHAKIGAIIILIAGFSLVLFGVTGMFFALLLFIIAAVLAFIR